MTGIPEGKERETGTKKKYLKYSWMTTSPDLMRGSRLDPRISERQAARSQNENYTEAQRIQTSEKPKIKRTF